MFTKFSNHVEAYRGAKMAEDCVQAHYSRTEMCRLEFDTDVDALSAASCGVDEVNDIRMSTWLYDGGRHSSATSTSGTSKLYNTASYIELI